uniref:Fibronectin type-III domain-containing protein n=1 Tax=Haemonchus contortus TaxID=6289 RepID=A0A7I4Y6A6_HAECO
LVAMFCGLPMSADVWLFFLKEVDYADIKDNGSPPSVLAWEWQWLRQVAALPRNHLDLSDPLTPAIQFSLECEEYWMALRPGPDFPAQPPQVNCAYQQGFSFEWSVEEGQNPGVCTTLADLVQCYYDYSSALDLAILQIKMLNNDKMTLLDYSFHDEDHECLVVQIRVMQIPEETVVVHVDWRNPTDFPRFISCSEEQRFRNLDCDEWDSDESLCNNLTKFFMEGSCEEG